jgi:hypothetical protein
MCAATTVHDSYGKHAPRPCRRAAKAGGSLCGLHAAIERKSAKVVGVDGGFCVGCAEPARSYVVGGSRVALCAAHGKALAKAIREGR